VEGNSAKQRAKNSIFRSSVYFQATFNRSVGATNENSQPFTRTANPNKVIATVGRGRQELSAATRLKIGGGDARGDDSGSTHKSPAQSTSVSQCRIRLHKFSFKS
jgi:hypothetical protein